ncbi:acetoin utilization protein AcuC [Bacillus taeanensis]|uniref:Acetoin utilization protein AcuC n=1 Tax=Bacillus taeanensis TaxID=273032 RepID=A0A366XZT5_9BACI|nr:acetoin utilization protein AcuC [Bacillus taeanensis]RBW71447.1 acetoin utilization protein AcuC [Bacillus taeanensis]
MSNQSIFIYSEDMLTYKFHDHHPFNHIRIKLTYDLLKECQTLSDSQVVSPRLASEEEIALVHDKNYIDAVKKAGIGQLDETTAANYGLGTEDTPIFPNMHNASALLVGATLTAAEHVMEGKCLHALNLGGGLHHGFRGKASGFCIYNDSAIAIAWIRKHYNARVLYVDTDAHHGDGVQWAFYDDPNVCTLSIHETGRYLFPGTGNYDERGDGQGYGFSFNIPVDAFTEDDSFINIYQTAIHEIAAYFKPDVILTQNGADAHYYDPLTHLSVTMKTYETIPKAARKVANQYCDGRWIAVGGGGYDIWRVVPRAWAKIWLEMNETSQNSIIPNKWIQNWQHKAPVLLPSSWEDPEDLYPVIPRKVEITEKNNQMLYRSLSPIHQHRTV